MGDKWSSCKYSCLKFSIKNMIPKATKFMDLENFSTDIDWVPTSKGLNDSFAIGFVDGSFKIITKLAKVEKTIADAHKGALITLKWSKGGVDIATAGEDGQIRV